MKRMIRVLVVAVSLGASLLAPGATAHAGADSAAPGPALFVGFDIGNEYALDIDDDIATKNGAWLLGASAKAFLPVGLGVGVSYFQTHHLDDIDLDGNFESVLRAGMLDLLVQVGNWDDETREYVSLHFGAIEDSPRGDSRASAGSYLVGGGFGLTFISRRETLGMAVGAELRYLLAPDADIAQSLLQGLITVGFALR